MANDNLNLFSDNEINNALMSVAHATNSKMASDKLQFLTEKLLSAGFSKNEIINACDELAMGERFPTLAGFISACRRHSKKNELAGCSRCDWSGIVHMIKAKEPVPDMPLMYDTGLACDCEAGKAKTWLMNWRDGVKIGYVIYEG